MHGEVRAGSPTFAADGAFIRPIAVVQHPHVLPQVALLAEAALALVALERTFVGVHAHVCREVVAAGEALAAQLALEALLLPMHAVVTPQRPLRCKRVMAELAGKGSGGALEAAEG